MSTTLALPVRMNIQTYFSILSLCAFLFVGCGQRPSISKSKFNELIVTNSESQTIRKSAFIQQSYKLPCEPLSVENVALLSDLGSRSFTTEIKFLQNQQYQKHYIGYPESRCNGSPNLERTELGSFQSDHTLDTLTFTPKTETFTFFDSASAKKANFLAVCGYRRWTDHLTKTCALNEPRTLTRIKYQSGQTEDLWIETCQGFDCQWIKTIRKLNTRHFKINLRP